MQAFSFARLQVLRFRIIQVKKLKFRLLGWARDCRLLATAVKLKDRKQSSTMKTLSRPKPTSVVTRYVFQQWPLENRAPQDHQVAPLTVALLQGFGVLRCLGLMGVMGHGFRECSRFRAEGSVGFACFGLFHACEHGSFQECGIPYSGYFGEIRHIIRS